jgi:hypothetical protein
MKQIVILIIVACCQVASAQFNTITMNRDIVKERNLLFRGSHSVNNHVSIIHVIKITN